MFLCEFDQGGSTTRLELWDTAGEEKFRCLAPMYVREADAAIIVFDVTDRESFEYLSIWLSLLQESAPGAHFVPQVVLFANKTDLANDRKVTEDEAREWADDRGLGLVEGSVRTCVNVRTVFEEVVAVLPLSPMRTQVRMVATVSQKRSCC
jgi:small GTP-binding protein